MVLRFPGSRLAATVAGLAARAMSALHNACCPSGVAGGIIADLTRSRAELITENAFLRQQLIVAASRQGRGSRSGHGMWLPDANCVAPPPEWPTPQQGDSHYVLCVK
jgi:hypothetical protein